MTSENLERLKHLLEHWIEHNAEHTAKYREWAEKVREEMPEVSDLILKAVGRFEEGEGLLKKARELLE